MLIEGNGYMLRLGWEKKREPFSILRIYTFSCLLFFILSFFNIYEFKVYDSWGLVVFYIYEGILWIGIKVGRARFYIGDIPRLNSKGSTDCFSFIINNPAATANRTATISTNISPFVSLLQLQIRISARFSRAIHTFNSLLDHFTTA